MTLFLEFINKKQREAQKHLALVERLLKKHGLKTKSYLEEEDPYIFLYNPGQNLSFEGIRIYEIADVIAYRVQNEEQTHPYGTAYQLNLEEMFNDYMSENIKEEEAGKKVIESVLKELETFFKKSAIAEDNIKEKETLLQIKTGGSDYSTSVFSKNVMPV